ncbi:MAG: U32 family peptidase [Lachnospiraceae bacterium]|nr:U32 family peptidase [Lachnospiraceae bacterium]
MKIMVPLSTIENIDRFRQAGADEFYFGFEHPEWSRRFGGFEELNRMSSFGPQANLPYAKLENVIQRIHKVGASAFVTINSPAYSPDELEFLQRLTAEIESWGPDGLIVGSIEACVALHDTCQLPLTASTMCAVYNTDILSFYTDLGIKRVILPRDIRLDDLRSMASAYPDVEFECFILRNGCRFSDANCLSYHSRTHGSVCAYINTLPAHINLDIKEMLEERREARSNHFLYDHIFHHSACGLCEVDSFRNLGISSLKIVGRADRPDEVEKDIALLRHLIDHEGMSRSLVRDTCLYGMNCYYQEPKN